MSTNVLDIAAALSDHDLLARLCALAGREREASAELVAHLAALESRPSAYAAQGYGSLYRCSERTYLEFHHVDSYARHGPATVENISLRCWRHNHYEAELVFGPHVTSNPHRDASHDEASPRGDGELPDPASSAGGEIV